MAKIERIFESVDADGVVKKTAQIIELRKIPSEPNFVKLYLADLGRIFGLSPVVEKILFRVAAGSGFDGIVSLGPRRKAAIASAVPCSIGTIDNSLSTLCRLQILRRVGRGEFELDPHLFAKGEWRDILDRRKAFSAKIVYRPDGTRKILETKAEK